MSDPTEIPSKQIDVPMTPAQLRVFIADHFEQLINRGDISVIGRNVRSDYVDHDGPGGRKTNLDESRSRTSSTLANLKDLRVEVRDIVAEKDKVVVRNVWTATDRGTDDRIEMHGFVLFRVEGNQLAERWATVTPPSPLKSESFDW
jgi:predicted ester cyclase